jgi:GNAT superfamily N-acetyltransferase
MKPPQIVQGNRLPGAARPNVAAPGANRPVAGAHQRAPAGPGPAKPVKAAAYTVQAPRHLGGNSQQIRATIQGSPQVAGSVDITRSGAGRAYISNLRVDQQHRRRGVAAQLIDAAITTARRQGFKAASLEARPSDNGISSQALVAMYRRQGFRSVGKSSRGSPLMERKL